MDLHLEHLDERTRALMRAEIGDDLAAGRLYSGAYLSRPGTAAWPDLLVEAVEQHDAGWLTTALGRTHFWVSQVPYTTRKGRLAYRRCPIDAPDRLAEGEFNRFYIHAGEGIARSRAECRPRHDREQRRARSPVARHPSGRPAPHRTRFMIDELHVVLDDESLRSPETVVGTLFRERSRSHEIVSFAYDPA